MNGHRKLLGFAFTAALIFTLALLDKGSQGGIEAIVWAFGVFVTGNAAVHVGESVSIAKNGASK